MTKRKFNIYLSKKKSLSTSQCLKRKKYKQDDDYRFIIADICHLLQNTGHVDFVIEGFPKLTNLSCDFDLMCAMEELPSVFNKIRADDFNFEILLYEQGTEKGIRFRSYSSESVEIFLCDLYGNRIDSIVLFSTKKEISTMLTKLHKDFLAISRNICPHLIKIDLMSDFVHLTDDLYLVD